jgi:hypothetical protein
MAQQLDTLHSQPKDNPQKAKLRELVHKIRAAARAAAAMHVMDDEIRESDDLAPTSENSK